MNYALLPFSPRAYWDYEGLPDIRSELQSRAATAATNAIGNLELLDEIVELLRDQPWAIKIDHCQEKEGRILLAVVGIDMGRQIDKGDDVNAGFFLSNCERGKHGLQASTRIFRVACTNGAIVEDNIEQTFSIGATDTIPNDWRMELKRVIDYSFSGYGIDTEAARLRNAITKVMTTPYEMLCHLNAQGLIDDDDQCAIQKAFDDEADFTFYGFVNAVTSIAHRLRDNDHWVHAFEMEKLGGEILCGKHDLPTFQMAGC